MPGAIFCVDEIAEVRKTLIAARRCVTHPYCITIVTQCRDYQPYMHGPANFVVIDEVGKWQTATAISPSNHKSAIMRHNQGLYARPIPFSGQYSGVK
jgi:hypothetical protein